LLSSVNQAQCGSTLAIVSVTPSGSAANSPSITWSVPPGTLNSTSTQGTYTLPATVPVTITITASDPLGCLVTATAQVKPAPPIPTFSFQNLTGQYSITCSVPQITLVASNNYTYGSLDYFWATPSQTFNTNSVVIGYPGPNPPNGSPNVTVTIKDPVTNCVTTKTTAVYINTVAPTVTYLSHTFQTINCTVAAAVVTIVASPTINVMHTVYNCAGSSLSSPSYSMIVSPGGPCTFTDVIVNQINGCSRTQTFVVNSNDGFPKYNLASTPGSFTLGCTTKSLLTVNFINPQSTPPGQNVTFTIMQSGSAQPPSFTTSSIFTMNIAGTYTAIGKQDNGCQTKVEFSVLDNKNGPPLSTLTIPFTMLNCFTPSVTLQGLSDSLNTSYQWNIPGGGNVVQGTSITVTTKTDTPGATSLGTYTLTITDNNNTCRTTTTVPMLQNLYKPNVGVAGNGTINCYFPERVLNNNTTGSVGNNPYPSRFYAIRWEGPPPQDPLTTSTSYTAVTAGEYTLTVIDSINGCIGKGFKYMTNDSYYPITNSTRSQIR
jgi:hypothetical protein